MTHHRRGLRRLLKDDLLLAAVEADPRSELLTPRRRAMLAYALKLTERPASVGPADIAELRAQRFGDAEILALAEVTAYYAFVNRIADGLGVEVEDSRPS